MQPISLAAKAVENPETLATLGEADLRGVLGTLTMVAAAAHAHWLAALEAEKAANLTTPGDGLLGTKEMCQRLGCSEATLQRGWKAGGIRSHGRRVAEWSAPLMHWSGGSRRASNVNLVANFLNRHQSSGTVANALTVDSG
jgi:hypothetical protein